MQVNETATLRGILSEAKDLSSEVGENRKPGGKINSPPGLKLGL
jgi:hypothetical protein